MDSTNDGTLVTMGLFKRTLSEVAAVVRSKVSTPMQERIAALESRMVALETKATAMRYCGVWNAARSYEQGNFVTENGSLWCANAASVAGSRPGTGAAWTLAVKHGRDLRDGRDSK